MAGKARSKTGLFIQSFDKFYEPLHKEGKMTKPNRESFFEDYLGLNKGSWRNFYSQGIKKYYYVIRELLEKSYPKS